MNKLREQKVNAIIAQHSTVAYASKGGPEHYLEKTRTRWFDPQCFFQCYPFIYGLLTAWLAPRLPFSGWRKYFPDFKSSIVVNLGCGTQRLDANIINIDFVSFPHVDITADFSEPLPLKDSCVDGILSISVLEHMDNPRLAANEIVRVLKKGGILYVNTPFLYPYHAAPYDYSRWTLSGLSNLFGEEMELVVSGPRGGVFCLYIITTAHLIGQLFSFGNDKFYRIFNHLTLGILAPLKYFDWFTCKMPFNEYFAPSYYWIARKK